MKKVATRREEVKEGKLFHQTLRTKTILLDLHLEVVMSKSTIIVYSIIKQASCNSKEIKTMEDFIVHKINIKTKQRMNTIHKKVALLKLEIIIIVLFCSSIEARIYQPNKAAHS